MGVMEKNNRRDFLKAGALLSGSVILSPAIGKAQGSENGLSMPANTDVKYRTLGSGSQALKVSALGLGCMGMSYHRSFVPDKKAMFSMLHKAYDLGVTFLIRLRHTDRW